MGTPSFGFSRAQGGATGFSPAQGGSAAAWTPESLTGLVDEWDAAATYCTTDAAADVTAASTHRFTSADNDAFEPEGDFSVCAWINPDALGGVQHVVSKNDAEWYLATSGTVIFLNVTDSVSGSSQGNASGLANGSWAHVVGTYTASDKKTRAYVNAGSTTEGAAISNAPARGTNALGIGARPAGGLEFDGQIAQVLIFKGYLLTSDDRTWLYNSGSGRTRSEITTRFGSNITEGWTLHEASGARTNFVSARDMTAVNTPAVAAGPVSDTVQDRSPVKTYTGKTNSETFDQSTIANQPRWIEDGDGSGNPALDFDGTNYTSTLTTTLTQGFTLAALVRFDAAGDYLFGGDVVGEFAGRGATNWEAAFGSTISGGTPDGSWHRMIVVANGASSNIYIDGSSVASGDIGAGGVAQLILGAKGDGSAPLDGRVRAVVVADSAAGASDVASLDSYLAAL